MATGKKKTAKKKAAPRGKVGGGSRFKQLTKELEARKGKSKAKNPKALAAWIGRKKYGGKRMAKMAAAGKKRKK